MGYEYFYQNIAEWLLLSMLISIDSPLQILILNIQPLPLHQNYIVGSSFSYIYKPIGAAPRGHFFVGGGGGVWAKKFVTLPRLRISEKKEILRKPTVL